MCYVIRVSIQVQASCYTIVRFKQTYILYIVTEALVHLVVGVAEYVRVDDFESCFYDENMRIDEYTFQRNRTVKLVADLTI